MTRQRLLQQMLGVILITLLLAGCSAPATPVAEAPTATATSEPPTATPTPEPPTATSTPEPTPTPEAPKVVSIDQIPITTTDVITFTDGTEAWPVSFGTGVHPELADGPDNNHARAFVPNLDNNLAALVKQAHDAYVAFRDRGEPFFAKHRATFFDATTGQEVSILPGQIRAMNLVVAPIEGLSDSINYFEPYGLPNFFDEANGGYGTYVIRAHEEYLGDSGELVESPEIYTLAGLNDLGMTVALAYPDGSDNYGITVVFFIKTSALDDPDFEAVDFSGSVDFKLSLLHIYSPYFETSGDVMHDFIASSGVDGAKNLAGFFTVPRR